MPSLAEHQSQSTTKLLLIGASGSGKTTALASLVEAGYKLRILDMDNGLDSLVAMIRRKCPNKIGNVHFVTLRDKYRGSPTGVVLDGMPQAWVKASQLLDKWEDGTVPRDWGSDVVVVIDSLTFLSIAAFNYANALNPTAKDKRQIYGAAQDSIEHHLALLTAENFKPNVVVTAHTKFIEQPDGTTKGYPTAVGQALSPKIGAYFNSIALCETGAGGMRVIRTKSTAFIDLKNPVSFELADALPADTALATFFSTVQGGGAAKVVPLKPA